MRATDEIIDHAAASGKGGDDRPGRLENPADTATDVDVHDIGGERRAVIGGKLLRASHRALGGVHLNQDIGDLRLNFLSLFERIAVAGRRPAKQRRSERLRASDRVAFDGEWPC